MSALVVSYSGPPYLAAYEWSAAGLGTKYPDPDTVLGGSGQGITFSRDGRWVFVTSSGSAPNLAAYPWENGFVASPELPSSTIPGAGFDVLVTRDNRYVIVTHVGSPYVSAYHWTTTGWGARFVPAVGITSAGQALAMDREGRYLLVAHYSGPLISAYRWEDGFASKYADPATLISSGSPGNCVCMAPAEDVVLVGTSTAPYLHAYAWSDAGFGTKLSDPPFTLSGAVRGLAFSTDGTALVIGHGNAVSACAWNGGLGGLLGNTYPLYGGLGANQSACFSPDGTIVLVGHGGQPCVTLFPWDSTTGLGTALDPPATPISGSGYSMAFLPDPLPLFRRSLQLRSGSRGVAA